ncbi:MAG TPA: hypothetical protein VFD19_01605 [Clostridia bacterium]|nr:hypothetical protein [Clostridia bacterium]
MTNRARQPVIVSYSEDGLAIDCLFTFNRRALRPIGETDPSAKSACDVIKQGIADNWSGRFIMTEALRASLLQYCDQSGLAVSDADTSHLQVSIRIEQIQSKHLTPGLLALTRGLSGKRRPVRIYVKPSFILPAHVASPLVRRFWGFFRTGQFESIGLNWSPMHPGYMAIPKDTSLRRLPQVAAHEAGHLFGLGDAYGAWYRFFSAAPETEGYMMRNNTRVHPHELAMLITAHATKRMQYFPRIFNLRAILQGLGSACMSPLARLLKTRRK